MQTKFRPGQIVFTPGAIKAMGDVEEGYARLSKMIVRHLTGDWGEMCDEDKAENERGLQEQLRLMSSYNLSDDVKIWIITEWDRSYTTILLPNEY